MNHTDSRLSVVMTVYDQASELRENLPAYLTQQFAPGYEVIVVDETSTDETPDVLKLFRNDYPHLYSTFLPKPNRLVVRRKLAISIGAKAAKHDWLVITNVHNRPQATDVLQAIASTLADDTALTLGYISRKGIRLQPFSSYEDARFHLRKAERRLKRVRNRRRMNYTWGRYDFIIVRKGQVHDILRYFEEQIPARRLFGIRLRILWKNLAGRSATTLLVTE